VTQHKHLAVVQKGDWAAHLHVCRQCRKAALELGRQLQADKPSDRKTIVLVTRLCCVAGATMLFRYVEMTNDLPAGQVRVDLESLEAEAVEPT